MKSCAQCDDTGLLDGLAYCFCYAGGKRFEAEQGPFDDDNVCETHARAE